jgi:hypothetical protein
MDSGTAIFSLPLHATDSSLFASKSEVTAAEKNGVNGWSILMLQLILLKSRPRF